MSIRPYAFAALGALALACQSARAAAPSAESSPAAIAAAAAPAASAAAAPAGSPDFASVAERILPSVVSIHVEQDVQQSAAERPEGGPGWFFRQFPGFGHNFQMPAPSPREGLGSGFVIDSSGLILTNYHVVDGANQIEVTLGTPDGAHQTMNAKVIGKAPDFDVALLKTDKPLNVPALAFADSDHLRVGEWVMAIGNPFGLSQSMSVGIISGKHRADMNPSGHQGIYDFLQTDASINPGNSGGPLVDMNGRVVGMNTAISAQGSGIGFAIPSSMLSHIFPSLKDKGELSRSYIGVQIQNLTPELAKSYGLPSTSGALVADVLPDSPAAKAGVQAGDVLTRFDGKAVDSSSALPVLVSLTESGHEVQMELWRNGKRETKNIRLETRPNQDGAKAKSERSSGGFGLSLRPLTPDLRQELGVDATQGALVSEVAPGSAAARAGLRPGDVVTEVQGKPVASPAELANALEKLASGQVVRLKVARGDGKTFVALEKP
ncbi:MAG TPA: trypsin-like peptidase domain-containing protein [Polyangiaceae bacterium]|nr:trypsin-like peptidase domain-containing protein [Polyangiaceae bacterium]